MKNIPIEVLVFYGFVLTTCAVIIWYLIVGDGFLD